MPFEYIIVGAGYSGLAQVELLKKQGIENVLLIEFEEQVGGRPWADSVTQEVPYKILLKTKVTKITKKSDIFEVTYQNSAGHFNVKTSNVILTTGSVESPRFFDFLPGDRPAGDMVPKLALNLLKRGYTPGRKPIILNSNEYATELISQLEHLDDVEVTTINPKEYEVQQVNGRKRVESVVVKNKDSGKTHELNGDALVYANGILPMTHAVLDMENILDVDKFVLTNKKGESTISGLYAFGDVSVIK